MTVHSKALLITYDLWILVFELELDNNLFLFLRHLGMSACASENLTVLELDNCPLVTDTSLDHLVGCHNLQRIELYDCQLITRQGIRRLRSHLPSIKVGTSTKCQI